MGETHTSHGVYSDLTTARMAECGPSPPSTSPKTLKGLVVYRLARLLLESSVPAHLRKYLPVCNLHLSQNPSQVAASGEHSGGCQYCEGPCRRTDLNSGDNCTVFDDSETVFDDVIIAEAGERNEHLLKTKENLLVSQSSFRFGCVIWETLFMQVLI